MAEKTQEKAAERHTGKLKTINPDGSFVITSDISIRSFTINPTTLSHLNIQLGDKVEFSVTPHNIVPHGPQCYSCHKVGHYASGCPSNKKEKEKKVKCYLCGKMGHYKWDCDRKFESFGYGCGFEGVSGCGSVSDFGGGERVVSVERRESVVEVERREDCFVLGFDPFKKVKSDVLGHDDDDDEEEGDYDDEDEEDDYDEDEEDEDDEEVRGIVSVKRREDVRKVEEVEDCFILEFDPSEEFSKLELGGKSGGDGGGEGGGEGDVAILGEKGKVACRDYPHPRHLCAKHPFKTTSHHLHCNMCYCYVCDILAPCQHWTVKMGLFQHCDATSDAVIYREMRDSNKKVKG